MPWLEKYGYLYHSRRAVHRLVVEKALGKPLRKTAPVHHADGDKLNNHPSNLVACDSAAYHNLLHLRERALLATGDPNRRACQICGSYSLDGLRAKKKRPNGETGYVHRHCRAAQKRMG